MPELKAPEEIIGVPTEYIFAMIVVALGLAYVVPRVKVEDMLPAEWKEKAGIVGLVYIVSGIVVMAVFYRFVKGKFLRALGVGLGGGFVIAGVIKALPG